MVHAPIGTPITAMIKAAGLRWNIEDDNKAGKDQLGLDHYQVRKWTPWRREVRDAARWNVICSSWLGGGPWGVLV